VTNTCQSGKSLKAFYCNECILLTFLTHFKQQDVNDLLILGKLTQISLEVKFQTSIWSSFFSALKRTETNIPYRTKYLQLNLTLVGANIFVQLCPIKPSDSAQTLLVRCNDLCMAALAVDDHTRALGIGVTSKSSRQPLSPVIHNWRSRYTSGTANGKRRVLLFWKTWNPFKTSKMKTWFRIEIALWRKGLSKVIKFLSKLSGNFAKMKNSKRFVKSERIWSKLKILWNLTPYHCLLSPHSDIYLCLNCSVLFLTDVF